MLLTWKQKLKHLTYDQYQYLRRITHLAKDIYNQSVYNIRQHYLEQGEFLRYESNYYLLKDHENYSTLGGGIAQQVMKCADASFKSFFGLKKLQKKGEYASWKIKLPGYLPKDGFYPVHFTQPKNYIREGKFLVPVSNALRKEIKLKFYLSVPSKLLDKNIHEIWIVPKHKGQMFEVRYIFEVPDIEPNKNLDYSKALAIDFGINNFATCVTSDGDSFILDGRKIKSINQWYNKEIARLSSIKEHQHYNIHKHTKLQYLKAEKRKRQIDDIVYCAAKRIVTYCIEKHIGNLVVGYNDGFQDNPRLGKKTKQLFCSMPYGKLKNRLEFLCNLHGIRYFVQEESYTSQASFWDKDEIPVYDGKHHDYKFSGYRAKRGEYIRKTTHTSENADINGALNILRKSNVVDLTVLYSRGVVAAPLRIRSA